MKIVITDKRINPLILGVIFILTAAAARPQNFSGGFTFNLPYNDSSTQKFLPAFPIKDITADGFIKVNPEGHFSVNGNRIRFWGTNLVADGAFPEKSKAAAIAGRLRKMGFNLIRFHHLDNPWSQYSLFYQGQSTRQLNPLMLDRMEYLIGHLKKNGIYINMNLNVGRTFNRLDGVPDADSLVDFGKAVTIFDPQLIMLQKEYAEQLLSHINPYSGLQLRNDPVMAMMEIINENSLYRWWHEGRLKPFASGGSLTIRHTRMLDSMWNAFLKRKYISTAALAAAWNEGIIPVGTLNQVVNYGFEEPAITAAWQLEQHNGASASILRDSINCYQGSHSCKIIVSNGTGTAWHLQFKQPTLSVKKDSLYTVSFAARSDSSRPLSVAVMRDNDPYTGYANFDCRLAASWRSYTFSFRASEANSGQARLTFQFASKGSYWLDEVKFTRAAVNGLNPGESLENGNVIRIDYTDCANYTDQRVKDMSEFYIAVQDSFLAAMKTFLKINLGIKAPITGTNWNIGPGDLISQSQLDYIDNHSYWDHPQFPGEPWSATDWLINNTPMVRSASGGTIPALFAGVAYVGKPFTVSEYNHAFPNRYQSEMPLFASAYLSFHDADGVMLFDYNGSSEWETDRINGYFDIHRNPVYMAQMPSAAYAFRNFFISPSLNNITVQFSRNDILLLPKNGRGDWSGPMLYDKMTALKHGIRNSSFSAAVSTDFNSLPAPGQSPYKTDTDEISYNTNGLLTVNSRSISACCGLLSSFSGLENGRMKLVYSNNLGAITWLSLDGDSLQMTAKSLLTLASVAQNTGMIWNGTSTVNNNWGSAPVLVLPLKALLQLNIQADSICIVPLDTCGNEILAQKKNIYPFLPNRFEITIEQAVTRSMWYGIEKYGDGTVSVENDEGHTDPCDFLLEQNYPNPFNPSTAARFYSPARAEVSIEITDILGRKVKTLYDGQAEKGYAQVNWDGKNNTGVPMPSGVYYMKARTGNKLKIIKLLMLK